MDASNENPEADNRGEKRKRKIRKKRRLNSSSSTPEKEEFEESSEKGEKRTRKIRKKKRKEVEVAESSGALISPVAHLGTSKILTGEEKRRQGGKRRLDADELDILRECVHLFIKQPDELEVVSFENGISAACIREWREAFEDYREESPPVDPEKKDSFAHEWRDFVDRAHELPDIVPLSPLQQILNEHWLTSWLFDVQRLRWDRMFIAGGALIALGAVPLLYLSFRGEGQRKEEIPIARAGQLIPTAVTSANLGLILSAEEAAEKFLTTSDLADKVKMVREPEVIRPLMDRWYAEHPEMLSYEDLKFSGGVAAAYHGSSFVVLKVYAGLERKVVPIVAEHTDDGYLIDWETSVGYQPISWEQFQQEMPTSPMTFRVNLRRSDYYNYSFSDNELYESYKISYPGAYLNLHGFVRKGSDLAGRLRTLTEFKRSPALMINLAYPQNSQGSDVVSILEIIQENWVLDYESLAAKRVIRSLPNDQ